MGAAATFAIVTATRSETPAPNLREELRLGERGLINPLVDCAVHADVDTPKENELQNLISSLVDEAEEDPQVDHVSVYFLALVTGPGIRIHAHIPFAAASLLKVPILIAYLRQAEADPGLLDRTLVYKHADERELRRVQNFEVAEPLEDGKAYTIRELLRRMIVASDNVAATMLVNSPYNIDIVQSLTDMGVPLIKKDGDSLVTVEAYASIFRILYNSTYLGQQASNEALRLLAQVRFKNGIEAGLDGNPTVAHKYGEREVGGVDQFHDCGIVYLPKRPYVLCVMTRGKDMKKQIEAVGKISRGIFEKLKQP